MARETRKEPSPAAESRRQADILGAEQRRRERGSAWGPAGHPEVTGGAHRHPGTRTTPLSSLSLGAAAVGVITASIGIVAPPAHADDYPSWNDVQQAKQSVAQQQALVDKINGLIAELQSSVDSANIAADKAAESYLIAKGDLDTATAKAEKLQTKAKAAAKTAKASGMRAGLLASHLAKTGDDSQLGLLLSGGHADASEKLLYQLGTMSQLTEKSSTIYHQAQTDKNASDALSDQAAAAETKRQTLADAASDALKKAKAAASAAESALAEQQSKQGQLVAQLATLKNTSEQQETLYLAGEQKKKQDAALAAAAAAPPPAPPAPAGSSNGSGGSSGGSGGSSGGAAPVSSGGGSVGAPNSSAVETAIAYAYAHLGAPYANDGEGPVYYDCSGLVMMAYRAAGIDVGYHSVTSQFDTAQARGQLVPLSQRQRGDIIFWYDNGFYHDAIYLGGNQIIAARDYGEPLAVQSLWGSPYGYVARPTG